MSATLVSSELPVLAGHGGHVLAQPDPAPRGVVVQVVVAPQLPLLVLRQAPVGVDPRGVTDQLLVVGSNDIVVALEGLSEGDEAGLGSGETCGGEGALGMLACV